MSAFVVLSLLSSVADKLLPWFAGGAYSAAADSSSI